ncbi:MAG: hypothetical protein WA148_07775 [Actinomycetota bacterium]
MLEKVVVDTCAYSNFALTGSLWILETLFKGQLVATGLVLEEIARGQQNHPDLKGIFEAEQRGSIERVSDLTDGEYKFFGSLPRALSDEDKSCLVVAKFRRFLLVTDDGRLQREASKHRVPTIGTVDILERGVQSGIVSYDEAVALLEKMEKDARFKSPRGIRR